MNFNYFDDESLAECQPIPIKRKPEEVNLFAEATKREKVKEDIYIASCNLANYLYKEKIANIVFFDSSARQAYLGLKEVWKKDYANEKAPRINFINPKAIAGEIDFPELAEEFKKKVKGMNTSESVLLYDVCAKSGGTIFKVKDFFEYLGFSDIRLAITSIAHEISDEKKAQLDLICLPGRANLGCNPFGKATYVENTNQLVMSPKTGKREMASRKLEHQKIKEVFND